MAVDLISADMQKCLMAVPSGSLTERGGPLNVDLYEVQRRSYRAIHVGERSEIHNCVYCARELINSFRIGDAALDKLEATAGEPGEIRFVACVCERIKDRHVNAFSSAQNVAHVI